MSDPRLDVDADFILLKRFGYSIKKLEERYPDGCPPHVIAAALGISEEDLATKRAEITERLKELMGA